MGDGNMTPCERCGRPQDDHWPGETGELCQECWEASCSETFWAAACNPANAALFGWPEDAEVNDGRG